MHGFCFRPLPLFWDLYERRKKVSRDSLSTKNIEFESLFKKLKQILEPDKKIGKKSKSFVLQAKKLLEIISN